MRLVFFIHSVESKDIYDVQYLLIRWNGWITNVRMSLPASPANDHLFYRNNIHLGSRQKSRQT